jgi:hypothetical protein
MSSEGRVIEALVPTLWNEKNPISCAGVNNSTRATRNSKARRLVLVQLRHSFLESNQKQFLRRKCLKVVSSIRFLVLWLQQLI